MAAAVTIVRVRRGTAKIVWESWGQGREGHRSSRVAPQQQMAHGVERRWLITSTLTLNLPSLCLLPQIFPLFPLLLSSSSFFPKRVHCQCLKNVKIISCYLNQVLLKTLIWNHDIYAFSWPSLFLLISRRLFFINRGKKYICVRISVWCVPQLLLVTEFRLGLV